MALGKMRVTACAIRCAVEWRRISRASSDALVRISTFASLSRQNFKSTGVPSTFPATAAFFSRGPMAAATSSTVEPRSTGIEDPSGSIALIILNILCRTCRASLIQDSRYDDDLISNPKSFSMAGSGSEGAPVNGQLPVAVFGKAITSLMFSIPAKSITKRSMPRAIPA